MSIIPLLITTKKKTTGQIKFLALTIKQQIKLVSQHSLCKNGFDVLVQVLLLHGFINNIYLVK